MPARHDVRASVKGALCELLRRWSPPRAELSPALWQLERSADGLSLHGVSLSALLQRFGSPLHVVNVARLQSNAARFLARPPTARRACEAFYSYKTNPVPGVLRALHASGFGAEVASPYELWLALEQGVAPGAIVYNGTAKSEESLRLAITNEIGLVNMNSGIEIGSIAHAAHAAGKRPRVGVRVVVPGKTGGQFGERIDTGAALEAFRAAMAVPSLRVVGLHAHYNGAIATGAELDRFVSALLAFTDVLHARLGLSLEVLDLGGNLVSPTVSQLSPVARRLALSLGRQPAQRAPESVLSIDRYVARVCEQVEGHYAARARPAPRIFLEPGRSATGDTQLLLCTVLSARPSERDHVRYAVVDAGINLAEPIPSEVHQLFAVSPRATEPELHRIVGPSCTMADTLYPAWRLPTLERGDALAIMDAGAYFIPFSTCFSFPRPPVVAVHASGAVELWRRRETFEDLVERDRERAAERPVCAPSEEMIA